MAKVVVDLKSKKSKKKTAGLFKCIYNGEDKFISKHYNLLKKYTILSDTFYTIIISMILAYLFNPIINYLEKKNIKRIWGVLLLYLCILGGILILSFLVIPKSGSEIKKMISDMPKYIDKASKLIDNLH